MTDMNDDKRFCTACGALLPAGATFCPECGAGTDGSSNPYAGRAQPYRAPQSQGGSIAKTLLLVYGVLAIVMAIAFLYNGIVLNEAMYNEMMQMYWDMGIEMPAWDDFIKTQMMAAGAFMIMSALAALASYWFCKKRGPKKNAVMSCAIASVLVLGMMDVTAIIMLIIGCLVTYMLYKDNTGFDC